MKTKHTGIILLLTVGLFIGNATAWGQDIKNRMRARLPEIVAMKSSGAVGENNQGYLAILKKAAANAAVVQAENQDRSTIYAAIAKKQGVSPELVGQRRALQIAQKADPGTWIQGADGKWKQK